MTECVDEALKVLRFTTPTVTKLTPIELHHGRKPRIELTNLKRDGNSYHSDLSELSVSADKKPKIPIYFTRDEEGDVSALGDVSGDVVMAKKRPTKKRQKHYRENNFRLVSIPLDLLRKSLTRYHLKGNFKQNYKPQEAERNIP